jgi:hypothetical protein
MTLAQNMKNWTVGWLLGNELVRIWNKTDVEWFKWLSTQLHGWTQQDVNILNNNNNNNFQAKNRNGTFYIWLNTVRLSIVYGIL